MKSVGLICTVHDPNGKNLDLVKKYSFMLCSIYSDVFMTVSDETDESLTSELRKNKFNIEIIPKKGAAYARREVLKFGLSGSDEYFHYCDFDRLLTWAKNYRSELKDVIKRIPEYDYLILGRTEKAFRTHPVEWIETEKITNRIFSLELHKDADVTAGSCAFSRRSGILISENSKAKMTDAEWPMIVKRIGGMDVNYMPVDGLEYVKDINSTNKKAEEAGNWLVRLKLAYIIGETAINTGRKD